MRALMLAAGLVIAATAPSLAADRKLEDFYGRYLGQGSETPADPAEAKDKASQKRMSEVVIEPAKAESGFTITWSTLRLKGDDTSVGEADTKGYHQTFRGTNSATVFSDVTSGDPLKGAPTSWAYIHDDTLSIVMVQVQPNGGYFVTHYDRTLTPTGMDVRFTRIENSRIVRAVELTLQKGPKAAGH